MKESTTYQAALREGWLEVYLEGKRENLLIVLTARFGTVASTLEANVNATTDIPTRTAAIRAAVTAASPDDIGL